MKNKGKLRDLTQVGLASALLCVVAPISVPIGDTPLSLATLVILIAAGVLGPWKSITAVCVYVMIGCVGLPVFAGFSGGVGRVLGPTGGFIVGYIILAAIVGAGKGRLLFMIAGTLSLYAVGAVWYHLWTDAPWITAISVCVLPFLPLDAVKIALSAAVLRRIR